MIISRSIDSYNIQSLESISDAVAQIRARTAQAEDVLRGLENVLDGMEGGFISVNYDRAKEAMAVIRKKLDQLSADMAELAASANDYIEHIRYLES